MHQVVEWLQRLIAAIILAGFLEMLIPNNELKKVTKMVMGLLIMMILVQPLLKIFYLPQKVVWSLATEGEQKVDHYKEVYPSTGQIIKQGLELRNKWKLRFNSRDQLLIKQKIKNIIGLLDEIHLQGLDLQYEGENLLKASLKVELSKQGLTNLSNRSNLNQKIKDSVQLVTSLHEDQIEVTWNDRK